MGLDRAGLGRALLFLGDPHQNRRHSRRLCQAIPLLSLAPPKRPLCLHSDWARVHRVGHSSFVGRAAPFGVWLAVVAASVVALIFAFVVMVRPPWWMKPRWLRDADADEWRHPPGPDSRVARATLATSMLLVFGSTCVYMLVNGSTKDRGFLLMTALGGHIGRIPRATGEDLTRTRRLGSGVVAACGCKFLRASSGGRLDLRLEIGPGRLLSWGCSTSGAGNDVSNLRHGAGRRLTRRGVTSPATGPLSGSRHRGPSTWRRCSTAAVTSLSPVRWAVAADVQVAR